MSNPITFPRLVRRLRFIDIAGTLYASRTLGKGLQVYIVGSLLDINMIYIIRMSNGGGLWCD